MSRGLKAKELFLNGYNCCQAVVLAFCDEVNLDKETALLIASSFGGGIGRLREVCGAVSGMFIVLGFLEGYDNSDDSEKKKELYASVQRLAKEFEEENGSYVCRELLGLSVKSESPEPQKRCDEYYKKRPCAELCEMAAKILENYIENK